MIPAFAQYESIFLTIADPIKTADAIDMLTKILFYFYSFSTAIMFVAERDQSEP